MADRLQELLQQRALIKEHLEWLDAEIAASSGRPPPTTSLPLAPTRSAIPARNESSPTQIPLPPAKPVLAVPVSPTPVPAIPDDADALIAQLAAQEKQEAVPSKSGCWLVFSALIFVILAGLIAAWYFFYR
jgi:hypothetical protein